MTTAPNTTATSSRGIRPRQAYEDGMPLSVMRRRFHLSESEAQDIAPEEFEDEPERNSVSGY